MRPLLLAFITVRRQRSSIIDICIISPIIQYPEGLNLDEYLRLLGRMWRETCRILVLVGRACVGWDMTTSEHPIFSL